MTDSINELKRLIEEYNKNSEDRITVKEAESLSKHTSFKIGGPADLFLMPSDAEALKNLIKFVGETGVKPYVLGNGTNLLFSDKGFRGAVISLSDIRYINVKDTLIECGGGTPLITVCKAAKENALKGLEFAYGIPGSVGGAVYMNAGAYGGETANVLKSSTYLDTDTLTVHTLEAGAHAFGYRDSIYKHMNGIILSAEFALEPGNADEIADEMNTIMNKRIDKQPLEYPSAGSVFKRCEGHFTGQMIEELGLKGYTIGGAQISEKHAGFIINKGGATAEDVLKLIEFIQEKIKENYSLNLECEVIRVQE